MKKQVSKTESNFGVIQTNKQSKTLLKTKSSGQVHLEIDKRFSNGGSLKLDSLIEEDQNLTEDQVEAIKSISNTTHGPYR